MTAAHIDDDAADVTLADGTLVPLSTALHTDTAAEIRRALTALEVAAGTAHLLGDAPAAARLEIVLAGLRAAAMAVTK